MMTSQSRVTEGEKAKRGMTKKEKREMVTGM